MHYRIIILSKRRFEEFQKTLEPLVQPRYLASDDTLLLIEEGIKSSSIHSYLKILPRVKLPQNVSEIVDLISFFIEAGIEAGSSQQLIFSPIVCATKYVSSLEIRLINHGLNAVCRLVNAYI